MIQTLRKSPASRVWALVFSLFAYRQVGAQESVRTVAPSSDWASVAALEAGLEVQIDVASGERVMGRLSSTTAEGVTISLGRTEQTVPRATIQRVVLLGHRLTGRYAKRGFIVGAVAGGLMGTLGTKSNRLPWGVFLGAGWGAIGATIGAINGLSKREKSVVYSTNGGTH